MEELLHVRLSRFQSEVDQEFKNESRMWYNSSGSCSTSARRVQRCSSRGCSSRTR
jgi:hypothetical protein